MKKNLPSLLLISGVVLLMAACGSKDSGKKEGEKNLDMAGPAMAGPPEAGMDMTPAGGAMEPQEKPPVKVEPVAGADSQEISKLGDFIKAWTKLYQGNEPAINAFEGMPIMGLVSPAITLAVGPQFDLLNKDNQDGRFEGDLIAAGKKGFIDKKGTNLTFGYRHTLEKDGFGPTAKKGDVQVLNGAVDLAKGYVIFDTWTERDGKKILATQTEYWRQADGSMLCLSLNGHSIDGKGDPSKYSNFIFLHNGAGKYDFVIGNAEFGPEFKPVTLADKGALDKAKAAELAKASGYKVEKTGGIKDGKLILE